MTATLNPPLDGQRRPAAVATPAAGGPTPPRPALKKDPRYLALRNFALSISVFNVLGYTVLGFEQPWLWPFLAVLTGYATEVIIETVQARLERRRPRYLGASPRETMAFFLPAHITSLAVNMLLYANDRIAPVLFGVVVAVSQKALLQAPINGRMRHYMNPSNLGITATLLVFPWVSIAPPYEFTEKVGDIYRLAVPMVIITAGTVINATLTKRVPLIVGWMGGFVIQAVVRWLFWDVALASALSVMVGVAFVLFTNYMITDPGTSPARPRAQFVFGASVAAVYGVLMVFNIVYTLFFSVTIVCAVRGAGWWVAHLRRRRARSLGDRGAPGGGEDASPGGGGDRGGPVAARSAAVPA